MSRTDSQRDSLPGALASWFATTMDISGPEHDEDREKILNDLMTFTQYAVNGEAVLVRTSSGRAILQPNHDEGVVYITYVRHDQAGRLTRTQMQSRFWMDRESLSGLAWRISSAGEAVDFNALMRNEEVTV